MATAVEDSAKPPPRTTAPGPVTLAKAIAAPATAASVTTTYIGAPPEFVVSCSCDMQHTTEAMPCRSRWLADDAELLLYGNLDLDCTHMHDQR